MTEDWHAPPSEQRSCPDWCADKEYAGSPDHPLRHTSRPLAVAGELPDAALAELFAEAVVPVGTSTARIALGHGDDEYVLLSPASSRSLAAALVRLADVLEGLAAP